MENKKEPQRMCSGCRERKNKKDLVRIVRNPEGKIFLDISGKASGRGAYICRNVECLTKAKKNKSFERSFKCKVEDDVYLTLEDELGNG